ncbi:MAG TPA: S8 family serine peptidase [Gaiellaceae bacterium]|nr:S8 family serine peptidase [Gaiellaceae bacterium]
MRRVLWLPFVAALVGVLAVTAASAATTGDGSRGRFKKIDLNSIDRNAAAKFVPASSSNRIVDVMVELSGQPVAVHEAEAHQRGQKLSKSEKNAIRAQLKAKQDALKGRLSAAGATVVSELQSAYNGVHVQVAQKDVAKLQSLPGVTGVHLIRTFKPSNVNGVPFIGAPQAWGATGFTGKGVKIADIDTGIDYTHADFGGPGTAAAWTAAQESSTEPADPTLFGPAAPKVKGGFDLVGDDYDADDPSSLPVPDPNPLDCNGHGTHTAGTVAGDGVLADGSTYDGSYDADTVSSNDWNVGPGVAPQADIYAYRVFGCTGSSNVVAEAIDMAVADGVDVITMSLGSDLGGVDDPTTVASENAVAAGITVVAAAGNAGPSGYIVSSPSTGDHVLSVAAMDASLPAYPGANLALSSGGSVDTIDANGADIPTGQMPVDVLTNSDGTIALGCNQADYNGIPDGSLVVTMRGSCARVARAIFGQKAGAAAVVMVNSDATLPPYEGPITSNPDTGEPYDVTIPFLGAAGTAANVAALLAADGGTVTLTPTTVPNTTYKATASFSSGGPRNPDSAPKPEVIAPGVSVASAGMGTGTGFLIESGTSMATPMTAGTAALVVQAHPDWTPDQVKAAIQNTADPSLNKGYNVRLAGTGVVQAQKAVATSVLAMTDDGLNSIAFGYVPGSGDYSASKTFTLQNTGNTSATYGLSVDPNGGQLGADVSVSPSSVTLDAGASRNVTVTLAISADDFAALPDATASNFGAVVTARGAIVATPTSGGAGQDTLRVAYLLVPRGLSDVTAGTPSRWLKPTKGDSPGVGNSSNAFTAQLPLSNSGVHAGTADLYAWGISDPQDTAGAPMDVRDVGVQVLPGAALGGSDSDRSLVFLVNTWKPATNQAVSEYDVPIDTNGDGTADYTVVGVDLGAVLTGTFNGQFASFIFDAENNIVDAWEATAPMNGSVIELPTLASEIGLGSGSSSFDYAVGAFSIVPGTLVDTTSTASFDPWNAAVSSGAFATLDPGASTSIPLTVSRGLQEKTKALGWLVAAVDNDSGPAQTIEVAAPHNLK